MVSYSLAAYNYSDHVDEVASPLTVVLFWVISMHMLPVLMNSLNPLATFNEPTNTNAAIKLVEGTHRQCTKYQTTKKLHICSRILLGPNQSTDTLAIHERGL